MTRAADSQSGQDPESCPASFDRTGSLCSLLDSFSDVVSCYDRQLRCVYMNRASERITGRPPETFVGKTHEEAGMPDEICDPCNDVLRDVFASGQEREIELKYPTPAGVHYLQSRYSPRIGPSGEVEMVVVVSRDISEKVLEDVNLWRAHHELEARVRARTTELEAATASLKVEMAGRARVEAELRTVLEALPVGVWLADAEGRIVLGNPAAQRIFGGPRYVGIEEYGEYKAWWADTGQPIESHDWALARAIERGETSVGEVIDIQCPDGARKTVVNSAVPVLGPDGAIAGAVALNEDITDRRKAERDLRDALRELETANRIKDEFLATLSHELRTPLTMVLGWVQLLRSRGYDQAKLDRALAAIEQGTKLQTQLIEDLLDVSRIISGKLRLDVQSVDMATVILAAAETVRPAAEAREQRLNVEVDPLAAHVAGDPARLRQVVWNLLSNAVKFTPQGGSVDVSLVAVPGGVEVVVRDTGRGIEPGFLPYVFDRFRQADSSVTREHGGLGLGLAIVRHIVEMHGGAVSVESGGLGCGATFRVRLSEAVREQVEPGEPADAASVRLDGVRVLLVEDRRDTRELVATMLEQFGATVVAVDGARAALAELDRSVPDVLVSDIGMHGGDGYSLIRAVRLRETARGGAVPAVALTAYAGPEDRIRAFAAGFHMHVPKPVEPLELALVVASLARG